MKKAASLVEAASINKRPNEKKLRTMLQQAKEKKERENYKPLKGYVLNLNQTGTKTFQDIEVEFLPHFMARGCLEGSGGNPLA
jgi:predicted SprT family Zn-dependent metalloprotease